MKYFILTLFSVLFLNCKQTSNKQLIASNFNVKSYKKRTELSKDVLKYVTYKSDIIALTNAKIYDGKGNPPKENQTIITENGFIQFVGNNSDVKIPKNATILNLKGKTLIPGIVGVHNHLHIPGFPFIGEEASKLHLASGVTTIQTCGSASPYKDIELSNKIKKGKIVGPNIITSGPYFTGKGGNPNMIIPKNEKQIRDTIKYWSNKGVQWFKVYRNTSPKDLEIIIDEAHKQNAKVTGHLCSVTFEEATNLGIDGIEHGFNSTSDFRKNKTYGICNGSREYIDELKIDSKEVKKLQQLMIDKNVFLTSTLAIYETSIPNRAFADERSLKVMSPYLVSQYKERRQRLDKNKNRIREKRFRRIMDFEYQFYKMGGVLTTGVDAGRHLLPGFGDQRNYELLKEAGFTTEETIKIMTGNGAKILSNSEIGTIERGKRADFVIISGTINQNIRNTELVFKDGYGYNPKLLLADMNDKFGLN